MPNSRLYASPVAPNYCVTVPSAIRSALGLRAGDIVSFHLGAPGQVSLRRIAADDAFVLLATMSTFEDWDSPEADRVFRSL